MAHARFSAVVESTFDELWNTLLDEIENPHTYNPGIKGASVIERFHDGVLRKVAVPDADVRERVTFDYDKGEITSEIIGHPQLVGVIKKTIDRNGKKLTLTSELEWKSTDDRVAHMIRRNVESFIMSGLDQVKLKAEKNTAR